MNGKARKLLIIGSANYNRNKDGLRIDCVLWDRLDSLNNISDYDVVLINLLNLKHNDVDWARFQGLLDFETTTDVLTNNGEIVVLGDARFTIPHWKGKDKLRPFLYWTGIRFAWNDQSGDTIHYATWGIEEFSEYRKHFKEWSYSLTSARPDEAEMAEKWDIDLIGKRGITPQLKLDAVCTNRYEKPLVFRVRHRFVDGYGSNQICNYGPILFLPDCTLDEDAVLQIALRDFCDAPTELPEPVWVAEFQAPGQKRIDEEISQIQNLIVKQTMALEKARQERTTTRTCLKLLYEREFALEPVVREVLRQLGAKVEEPVDKNKEDGWITVVVGGGSYEGVLEIKSTKSDQFGEDGRKQLLDWIDRGRTIRGKNYKGIFIGNSAVQKPLKMRPGAFSDSWKKAEALSQICAVKSVDLYWLHVLNSRGELNTTEFWKSVFSTNGIFDIKPFLPKRSEAK